MAGGSCLKPKHYALLGILTGIPFIVYALTRNLIIGTDSYFFLHVLCNGKMFDSLGIGMQAVVSFLPCDYYVILFILFTLALASVLAIAKLGELFFPENGWLAGVFVFLSPLFILEFCKFENDQFAFPFLFFSVFLFVRGLLLFRDGKNWESFVHQLAALVLIGFVGVVFWNAAVYLAFGLVLSSVFFCLPVVLSCLFWEKFWAFASPFHQRVWENLSGIGLGYIAPLLFGLLALPLELLPSCVFFLLLSWANAKLSVFALPFLAVGMVGVYERWLSSPSILSDIAPRLVRIAVYFMLITCFFTIAFQPPHPQHFQAIDFALEKTKHVQNDWEMGWWVLFSGGKTENISYAGNQWQSGKNILITDNNVLVECPLAKNFGKVKVFDCRGRVK